MTVFRALEVNAASKRGEGSISLLSMVSPLCLGIALATLAASVAFTHLPPLPDYPNHMARIWLLAGGLDHAPLNRYYSLQWAEASTNIGVDLLAVTLGRLIGAAALMPMLLGAAIILPPLGAMLLNRAVFRGWHWWQVGFAVLAWCSTLLSGFLNFQIGLGLALIAASTDPAITRYLGPWGTALARVALGGGLMVFHMFAMGFYGALIAGLAFGPGRLAVTSTTEFGRAALRCATATGCAIGIPLAVFLLSAPILPGGHAPPGVYSMLTGYTLIDKLITILSAIATYDPAVDMAAMILLWVPALLIARFAQLRVHAGLCIAGFGLLLVALIIPSTMNDTAYVDWRFPIMGILTLAAAIRPETPTPRSSAAAACALLLLAVVRAGWVFSIWHERQADSAAVEQALAQVPPGAAVMPAMRMPLPDTSMPRGRIVFGGLASFTHYASLAVFQNQAFVPTLFTAAGKQPLRVLAPWDSVAVPEGIPAPVACLRSFTPSPGSMYLFGYIAHWRERFDYVLVLNTDVGDGKDEAAISGVTLVADKGFARLYKVTSHSESAPDTLNVTPHTWCNP
jgi:hypothetical protein